MKKVSRLPLFITEKIHWKKRGRHIKKPMRMPDPCLYIQTVPILEIIQEEAKDYFNGNKSAEEIGKVINNRVQLYLNERK